MGRITFATSAAMAGVLLAAAGPGSESDRDRLQGSWVMVSIEVSGEEQPEDQVASASLLVKGDRYTPRFNDREVEETFKLDPGTSPRSIDFTYIAGPRKGETVKGIYKLEDDRYVMCRPLLAEAERPTRFATSPNSGLVLVVWGRDSPAERARRKSIDDDRKALDGTWVGEFNRRDGKTVPTEDSRKVRLILARDRYTMERPANKNSRGTDKIDPSKSPKTIDINIIDGEYQGQTWHGIYEIEGDTYRSCFATSGKARPTSFTSEPGSGHILWVFRRDKP